MVASLKFTNGSDKVMKIILEPWAEEYLVDAGATVEVIANGESKKNIEIEHDGEDLIVYGWSDSMTVLCNGIPQEPQFD